MIDLIYTYYLVTMSITTELPTISVLEAQGPENLID